jgi:hypothetical protein
MAERLGTQLQSGGLEQSIHTGLLSAGLFGGASLDLNFAVTKNVGPLVSFTRASSATYIDSAGTLQTAAVDVPRFDHNPTTGESLGLLVEEQRTNLLLNTATLSTQSVTVTAVAHTLSFYGSGTVTLSGASTAGPAVGSGAFPARTTLTFTPSAGTLTLTVTGSVTSAQLEAGAFATSYIATTSAAATRAADVASITGANFSSWYNATEGTIYHQGSTASASNFFSIDDSTVSNRITSYFPAVTTPALFIATGGTTQANISSSAITAGSTFAQANAYKANDFVIVTNGGAASTDTSGSVPTVNKMVIGANVTGAAAVNGTIRRLTYWPQRLPNSTLQAITQ